MMFGKAVHQELCVCVVWVENAKNWNTGLHGWALFLPKGTVLPEHHLTEEYEYFWKLEAGILQVNVQQRWLATKFSHSN